MKTQASSIAERGTEAVKRMRLRKLGLGHPFMINTRSLGEGQCYLEYPDGHIVHVSLSGSHTDFQVIRQLSEHEAQHIRVSHHL